MLPPSGLPLPLNAIRVLAVVAMKVIVSESHTPDADVVDGRVKEYEFPPMFTTIVGWLVLYG